MQLALRDHQSTETMDELRALNARFIHNFVTNDVASHDAILHPRFINIWPTGQRWDRATYLKYWATAFDPDVIVYWDVRDELITVIGDVALVRSTNKCTRRRDGNEVTGMTTYTDTYLFENGAWKCIQAQITAVAPEHYPADDTIVSVYIKGKLQRAGELNATNLRVLLQPSGGGRRTRHAANVRLSPRGRDMLKLYYAPGTCALASHIALEEAGAAYTAERLDFKNNQQTSPQYLAINPKGRVPALVTDRGVLTETPAILAYIAQSFPQAKLVPRRSLRVRAGAVLQQLSLLHGAYHACAQDARLSLGGRGILVRRHEAQGAGNHGRQLRADRARHAEGAVGDGRAVHGLRSLSVHARRSGSKATASISRRCRRSPLTASGCRSARRCRRCWRRRRR